MTASPENHKVDRIAGCLIGTAIGDSLGLPMEGISRPRQARMYPDLSRHHFLFGRGMVSDDTEHQVMTALSLAASGGDVDRFARDLAWRLRFWMARLPAGVGLATLRAIGKLWIGFSPQKSGVFSAGNGPAMRAPIIGVCYGDDRVKMNALVRVCTRVTHTDPKAEWGALSAAVAAHHAANGKVEGERYLTDLKQTIGPEGEEFTGLIEQAVKSAQNEQETPEFADRLGLEKGVSGYMLHTMPVVIQAWLRHQGDFSAGLKAVIACGGDTDTTGAIIGGILGAGAGLAGLPRRPIETLMEWPLTEGFMEKAARALDRSLTEGTAVRPPRLNAAGLTVRNLFFLAIVLAHGFRRLAPPY